MPQLDSLDAGERTHIIFAPQSAPLRRQPEDLTAFERTVFNHVGLTHPRALLSHLDKFVSDQELSEHHFDERLSTLQTRIESQMAVLEQRRGQILAAPPWPGDQPPTTTETEQKTKRLIESLTDDSKKPALSGLSLGALIEHAQRSLRNKEMREQGAREVELDHVRDLLSRVRAVHALRDDILALQASLRTTEQRLTERLSGASLDDLRARLQEEREILHTSALRRKLAADGVELLRRDEEDPVSCPFCTSERRRADLELMLSKAAGTPSLDDLSSVNALTEQIEQAETLTGEAQTQREQLAEIEAKVAELVGHPELRDYVDELESGRASAVIDMLTDSESSIEAQISDEEAWFDERRAALGRLEEEERYHQVQKQLHDARVIDAESQRVSRAFANLVSFGESVRDIQEIVASCLTTQLADSLPGVERDLTRVFVALTRHPYYDRLVIDKHQLPRLELQVSSSHDSSGLGHATGVLNGQAESALKLVPYFALSQTDEAPTEVYLVLLDDPTQAFDGEHIEILVERLADLGRRVQLIVASQETAMFRDLLPRSFQRSSYVIVEPKNWSHSDGPDLNAEYA